MRDHYLQTSATGLLLFIKLTPNARNNEIVGEMIGADGPVLAAKVTAIADKGKANKALIALISTWLGVAKSDIALKAGGKSRFKTLAVRGETNELIANLKQKQTN